MKARKRKVGIKNGDGAALRAAVVQGTDGNFYGMTVGGGNLSLNSGVGFRTVFKMTPAGVLTTLGLF